MDNNCFLVRYDGRRLHIEQRLNGQDLSSGELALADAGKTVLWYAKWLQDLKRLARQERRPRAGHHPEYR